MRNPKSKAGFSLVELLCATAIIAILGAVAINASAAAIEQTRSVECLSNLRQIGAAMGLYVGERNGRLPSSGHHRAEDGSSLSWTNTLADYLGTNFIGRCPAQASHPARVTYGWNDLLTEASGENAGAGISIALCRQPASTLVVAELATNQTSEHFHFRGLLRNGRITYNQFRSLVNVSVHGKSANYLFVDGHVASLPASEIQHRITPANSPLINP